MRSMDPLTLPPAGRSRLRGALLAGLAFTAIGFGPGAGSAVGAQETHLIVVSGLGGEPQFRRDFEEWGARLVDGAIEAGARPEHVHFLAEDPEADPERIRARSTREEVEAAFREVAARAAPEDRVLVVLIGHGSGSGEDSRVGLPGPSLRAADYAALLDELAPRMVALVNVASASGDFVPVLAGEGRIVITATRSSQQRNAALFGRHFADAFQGARADLDRDGRVSLLEAFEYARQETERHYRDRGLIVSEQALLEDRAEGRGVPQPMDEGEVGTLAARFFLGGTVPAIAIDDPEIAARLRALYQEQDALETEIAALTQRRATMEPAEYQATLQPLLVELARVGQAIRELEGGG